MLFYWNPNPIAISFLGLKVYWYGILFAVGFILGYIFIKKVCSKAKLPIDKLDSLLFYIFLGTVVGARLAHVLFYQPNYYLHNPLEIFFIWHGGLASHGGILGAFIGYCLFCKKNKEFDFFWLLDRICIPVSLEVSFIRIGNFINSEIVGIPTDGNYGVIFEKLSPVPLHPVQLYESFSYLILFSILLSLFIFKNILFKIKGVITGFCFVSFFSVRAFLEIFKQDQSEYEESFRQIIDNYLSLSFDVSVGMILSIPFIIFGLILIYFSIIRYKKNNIKN